MDLRTTAGRVARALPALVSLAALVAVVLWAAGQPTPRLPDAGRAIPFVVAAVLTYALAMAVRGERWHRLLGHEALAVGRADAQALTVVGYAGNNVLPARGGDLLRVALARVRVGSGLRAIAGTLVAERVLDVALLAGFFAVAAVVLVDRGDLLTGGRVPLTLGVLAGGALAAVVVVLVLRRLHRGRALLERARPLWTATRRLRGAHGRRMLLLTALVWGLDVATWGLCAGAAGLDVSVLEVVALIGLVALFILVPAGPGNLGTLDAAVVVGGEALGAAGATTLSFLLVLRFVLLVPVTLAGGVALVARFGRGSLREARAART